jgi:hypothetical protein
MGGRGSGRQPSMPRVADYDSLKIGPLVDGGRLQQGRSGKLYWETDSGAVGVRLTYRLCYSRRTEEEPPLPCLDYTYWPRGPAGPGHEGRLWLRVTPGQPILVECSELSCERAVRILYSAPGEARFLCRRCAHLRYPRHSQAKQEWQQALTKRLEQLERLGFSVAERHVFFGLSAPQPKDLAETLALISPLDLDGLLWPQESRLAALQLQAEGLSIRQIAARLGHSKSNIQRLLAAGFEGLDLAELFAERSDPWRRSPLP